jgi:Domain of unknown function (DUF4262)
MCWQCDHPGGTWHDYLEHLRGLLEEHCWIVQGGPHFAALQLVYADDRGHWPWDAGFRGGRGGQPVLGARSTVGSRAGGGRT